MHRLLHRTLSNLSFTTTPHIVITPDKKNAEPAGETIINAGDPRKIF